MLKKNKIILANLYIENKIKNTIFNITHKNGNLIKNWSTQALPKTQVKKNNIYNIIQIIYSINRFIKQNQIKNLIIYIKGTRSKSYIIKHLENTNVQLLKIINKTKIPFNGCRPKKKKRK